MCPVKEYSEANISKLYLVNSDYSKSPDRYQSNLRQYQQ